MAFLKHLHDCLIGSPDIFTDYRVAGQCSGIFREVSEDESRKHDKEQHGKHQNTECSSTCFHECVAVLKRSTDSGSDGTSCRSCFCNICHGFEPGYLGSCGCAYIDCFLKTRCMFRHVTYAPFFEEPVGLFVQWIRCRRLFHCLQYMVFFPPYPVHIVCTK